MFRRVLISLLLAGTLPLQAQIVSNLKYRDVSWIGDSIVLDTLSLVPGSVQLRDENMSVLDSTQYEIDYFKATVYPAEGKSESLQGRTFKVYYRTYPFNLSQPYRHKDVALLEQDQTEVKNPFVYSLGQKEEDFFYTEGLNKSGSIARGVSVGNNQDLAVNSNLDLQLSGKLTEDVKILAAISDDNLPIQPEGNTQQLQEFDRVYIQLYNDKYKLIAGDYRMQNDEKNYFLKYNKSLQGGSAEAYLRSDPLNPKFKRDEVYYAKVSAAVSKGKFAINKFQGIEGNQGPYLLTGADNENFIIIISGTEKVYIDGKLMQRGQNFDYVIDYNSAELTFTPNQIITKDKRITVEFQYSDRYYGRNLFHVKSGYENKKMNWELNYYNEGDDKSQPLDRELSDDERRQLSLIGDSLGGAVVPNIRFDTSADLSSEILYKLEYQNTTFGPDSFFVYSTNPDSAVWRVGFAFVGENQGDYIQAVSDANGKVYEFVPRDSITGLPQGNYLPFTFIVTPKRNHLVTLGGTYNITDHSSVTVEGAYSHNDINTFSTLDDNDNDGYAFMIQQDNSIPMGADSQSTHFDVGVNYDYASRQFKQVERFRSVEFFRDWNLPQPTTSIMGLETDQHRAEGYVGISKQGLGRFRYSAGTFQEDEKYRGVNNKVNGIFNYEGFEAWVRGSYLTATSDVESSFLRYTSQISQDIGPFNVGVLFEEENIQYFNTQRDSLFSGSLRWTWWQAFIQNADSSDIHYKISYRNRYDYLPDTGFSSFSAYSFAEDYGFDLQLLRNPKHQFLTKVTYRRLEVLDSLLYTAGPEDNILGKIDYQGLFVKNLVTWQTYYEIGSGLELKKEVQFVGPLDPGQGNYVWNDLNDDGIQQKNEFFVAPTPQEGIYNRVLLPTNEFERAFTNIYNQVIFIKPEGLLSKKTGALKFLSYFSDRLTYRIDKKSNEANVYNPFQFNFESDSLLSLNNSVLNTFYINRLSPVFGFEFNYRENNNRSLLVSGKETRFNQARGVRGRWNITKMFTLNSEYEEERRGAQSENFTNRDFDILSRLIRPEFFFQPGIAFRIGVNFQYEELQNSPTYGNQFAMTRNSGVELRYNVAQKGSFQLNANYILIAFEGEEDPVIVAEMLEGLLPGRNATWNILYQRNIGKNLQLNVNYSGRQSEGSRMVHLGGAQVRAFF